LYGTHQWSKIDDHFQKWLPYIPEPIDPTINARIEAVKAQWIEKYGDLGHFQYPYTWYERLDYDDYLVWNEHRWSEYNYQAARMEEEASIDFQKQTGEWD
jgi:hypothetical protein